MSKVYNKLVRDKIPEIIEASGKKPNYRVLSNEEYRQALKDKLLEEVNEFLAAETHDEIQEEIADIREVIGAIIEDYKSVDSFDIGLKKYVEKGGFSKRYFLESVED